MKPAHAVMTEEGEAEGLAEVVLVEEDVSD
jgi:hypothetical protein